MWVVVDEYGVVIGLASNQEDADRISSEASSSN